jgi:hypothetical protein
MARPPLSSWTKRGPWSRHQASFAGQSWRLRREASTPAARRRRRALAWRGAVQMRLRGWKRLIVAAKVA